MNSERLAFDRLSVRTKDIDGRLHVSFVRMTKANVSVYLGNEIPGYQALGLDPGKRYRLYRDPDALEKAVPTANNIPLLSEHRPVSAERPAKELIVGSTGTDAKWQAPYVTNSLVVWDAKMIARIEGDEQKELSAAYRYRPVMEPGSIDGEAFDGKMVDIVFNHLAVIPEGRVGKDVVIGDSKENLNMKDRNTAGKAKFAADALKLAQDGKFDELREFLEAFSTPAGEGQSGGEEMDAEPPALGGPPEKPVAPPAAAEGEGEEGGDPIEAVKKFLVSKGLTDEDMAELDRLVAKIGEAGAEHEEAEEGKPPVSAEKPVGEPDRPVNDEDPIIEEKDKDMVSKPAMDAAIAAAVHGERQAAKELRDAERFVRPFVGELAMTFDSADKLLRAAAKAMKVPDADKVHPSALRSLITMAGTKPARAPASLVAMDAASADDYAKRFPNSGRLKN